MALASLACKKKIHAQNIKKTESQAFMKINDKIVNKKLEEQTTKLDDVVVYK